MTKSKPCKNGLCTVVAPVVALFVVVACAKPFYDRAHSVAAKERSEIRVDRAKARFKVLMDEASRLKPSSWDDRATYRRLNEIAEEEHEFRDRHPDLRNWRP